MSTLLDEAERVSCGERPRWDRHQRGGEWDALHSLPPRRRRSLIAAGYLTCRGGEQPDVFAGILRQHWPALADATDCDIITAWVRLVANGLAEQRAERRRARRTRLALRNDCDCEYHYRTMQALAAGHVTFWRYRQARGWR